MVGDYARNTDRVLVVKEYTGNDGIVRSRGGFVIVEQRSKIEKDNGRPGSIWAVDEAKGEWHVYCIVVQVPATLTAADERRIKDSNSA
jgi:hypothetical protein